MTDDTLQAALARHEIELADTQIEQLDAYCRMLWDWNEKINLTRHTTYDQFVARDLVDTLALAEFIQPKERVLDMGSGGGVPGIPLQIVRPDLKVGLTESVTKKAKVLADMVKQLDLKMFVNSERAEAVLARHRMDTVTVRAVAKLPKLLHWLQGSWDRFERLMLIKGPAWVAERGESRHLGLMKDLALRKLKSYPLAGTDSESVVLMVCPKKKVERYTDHG